MPKSPDIFFTLTPAEVEARLAPMIEVALGCYGVSKDAPVTLINVSENATYLIEDETGRSILRVHRHDYHDSSAIESELQWLDALRESAGVRTPQVLHAIDGHRVVALPDPGDGRIRHLVRFEFVEGQEPAEADVDTFALLGEVTARMHLHSRRWRRPASFSRFSWDLEHTIGALGRWGPWRDGIGLDPAGIDVLEWTARTIGRRLEAFGNGPDRYGLIHADLRAANLLVDGGELTVIDFDDCGFGWFLADLGGAVTFIEHDPRVPEFAAAWAAGYRRVAPLKESEEAELPTFVMLRRLMIIAWLSSHPTTDIALAEGATYSEQSCELAATYLSKFG